VKTTLFHLLVAPGEMQENTTTNSSGVCLMILPFRRATPGAAQVALDSIGKILYFALSDLTQVAEFAHFPAQDIEKVEGNGSRRLHCLSSG